uniref:Zinc finger matrin-type protein CG9776 n=1 Tax=Bactrocera latifrons TaxID=174628 RepID=A0A0K8UGB5_BACLA
MDEELILQQPADRRLGTANTLPPGPPGAENDVVDYEANKPKSEKESNRSSTSRSSRRRSPSGSPPRSRRKSPSRGRRSPSPLESGSRRRRRSPSPPPRRNRFRDYSPDRRRFDGGGRNMFRSPDRRRGGGGRDFRYRGRSNSRSRSRSVSPRRKGGSRWSPKKKPSSPLPINAPPPPQVTQPQTQYNPMPPQLYTNDTYAPQAYNQYAVPPPQQAAGFPPQTAADAYGMQAPAPPVFNAAYPPPPVWTANDAYAQQPWIPTPDPSQLPQIAQQPPPVAAPTAIPPPQIVQQPIVTEPTPVTIESNSKHDAVAQEAENQRDELKRQRSSYLKKTSLLRQELKMLKDQRKDLHSGGAAPPSPTTKGFIDENEKLQVCRIMKKFIMLLVCFLILILFW